MTSGGRGVPLRHERMVALHHVLQGATARGTDEPVAQAGMSVALRATCSPCRVRWVMFCEMLPRFSLRVSSSLASCPSDIDLGDLRRLGSAGVIRSAEQIRTWRARASFAPLDDTLDRVVVDMQRQNIWARIVAPNIEHRLESIDRLK